jgi:hypothetical protein
MDLIFIVVMLAIAFPIGLFIGMMNDKQKGKNNKEWKELEERQKKMEEIEEILNELKGNQNE